MNDELDVSPGQEIQVQAGDYMYGAGPYRYGDGLLRLRVTRVPPERATLSGDWIALVGVEIGATGVDAPECPVIVRARALGQPGES